MREEKERAEAVAQVANALRVAARLEIEEKDPDRLLPAVMGELLFHQQHDPRDFLSHNFGATLDHVVGRVIMDALPDLLRLADVLKARGAVAGSEHDFGYADKYGSLVLDEPDRKAMAFRTQNVNYLVFLKQKYGRWTVHLRQWFEELTEERLQALTKDQSGSTGYPFSLAEAAALANALAAYSDDFPGNSYPHRLSLKSFGDWSSGNGRGCSGLRYLDLRDTGYLGSAEIDWKGDAVCERVSAVNLGTLHYVWYDLLSVLDTLVRSPENVEPG